MKSLYASLAMAMAVSLAACSTDNNMSTAEADRAYQDSATANNQGRGGDDAAARSSTDLQTRATTPQNTDPQLRAGSDKTHFGVAISGQDRGFIAESAQGNTFEIQASQKALDKSASPRIKTMAQQIIDDHTVAQRDLTALAQRKGVELSSLPNEEQIKMLKRLDDLNGNEFDKEYLSQQIAAHQQTIEKFKYEADNGMDSEVRSFAAKLLPTLQAHLDMVNNDKKADISAQAEMH